MLRNRRGPLSAVESKDQKLFNLIVSNYLSSESECIEPFTVPEDLLQYANGLNANVLVGSNCITFTPAQVFSEADLKKLTDLKSQLSQLKTEIHQHKQELGIFNDSEVTAAHKTYMDRLHRYNEAKDVAQALLGKLAQLTGTTTRDLYPNFNLSFDD